MQITLWTSKKLLQQQGLWNISKVCKPKCFGNILVTARVTPKFFHFCWEHMEHLSVLEAILEMTPSAAPTLLSNYQIHIRFSQGFLRFWSVNRSKSRVKIRKFLIIALSCYRRTFYGTYLLHLYLSKPH